MPSKASPRSAVHSSDPRWAKVQARDARADGEFFYSVETTGVYCRPSCAARTPRPENVAFHLTTQAAEKAGFRPCKRCKPGQPSLHETQAELISELCRFMDRVQTVPSLAELAERARCSPYHLHRVFKAVTGLTPRAYASERRAARVRAQLERGSSVTEALHEAGFSSSGRFYERADQALGMTPSAYRAGGELETITFAQGRCSLGAVLVAASTRGVCAILLGDDAPTLLADLRQRFPRARLAAGGAPFESLVTDVVALVEAPQHECELTLDVRGSVFQARVWQALRQIPVGETRSYRELAQQIGAPRAVRAVASACAANALAVLIPCHRVVRGDGALAGYRWGVDRKRELLEREAKIPSAGEAPSSSAKRPRR